jgi:hypothetical protein
VICGIRSGARPARLRSRNRWLSRRSDRKYLKVRRGNFSVSLLDSQYHRRYISNLQTRTILIIPSNQKRNTKWPTHNTLLTLGALAKPQRQIAYRLRAALDTQRLVVVEGVVLRLDARMLDHAAGVGLQPRHGAADVVVDLHDLFDGRGFQERRGYAFLYAENYAFAGCYLLCVSWIMGLS